MHFLIVTHDAVTEDIFRYITGELNAAGEYCSDVPSSLFALEQRRFDVVVIDCDDVYRGDWLLRNVHKSLPNRSSVLVAITNGGTHPIDAEDLGADFVLSKPFSPDQARDDLHRVCHAVAMHQRHDKRHPVQLPIFVSFGQVIDRRAEMFNLSLGGIGLRLTEPIEDDDIVHVRFWLPDCGTSIQARGEIAWSDREGNTGIKFLGMNPESRRLLRGWLDHAASKTNSSTDTGCLMPSTRTST